MSNKKKLRHHIETVGDMINAIESHEDLNVFMDDLQHLLEYALLFRKSLEALDMPFDGNHLCKGFDWENDGKNIRQIDLILNKE